MLSGTGSLAETCAIRLGRPGEQRAHPASTVLEISARCRSIASVLQNGRISTGAGALKRDEWRGENVRRRGALIAQWSRTGASLQPTGG